MKFKRLIASKPYCISLDWEWLDENDSEIKKMTNFAKNNGAEFDYCRNTNGEAFIYISSPNLDSFLKVVKEFKGRGLSPYEMGMEYDDTEQWKNISEEQGIDFEEFNNKIKNVFNCDYDEILEEL